MNNTEKFLIEASELTPPGCGDDQFTELEVVKRRLGLALQALEVAVMALNGPLPAGIALEEIEEMLR
jgi:hypothetical protein